MPRPKTPVKRKTKAARTGIRTGGAVDLHFHGAFGIDLMSASGRELTELSSELSKRGVAAFCPTTLSVGKQELRETVSRLGPWVREALDQPETLRERFPWAFTSKGHSSAPPRPAPIPPGSSVRSSSRSSRTSGRSVTERSRS